MVTAVAPVVIKGKGLWVGWPGIHLPADFDDEKIPESDPSDQTPTAGLKSNQVKSSEIQRVECNVENKLTTFRLLPSTVIPICLKCTTTAAAMDLTGPCFTQCRVRFKGFVERNFSYQPFSN